MDYAKQIIVNKSNYKEELYQYGRKFDDRNKFENLIITIVRTCIANIHVQGEYYANFAIMILDKYAGNLEPDTFDKLVQQLITICVDKVPNGGLPEVKLAIMVLDSYTTQFNRHKHAEIITKLIKECIAQQNYNTPILLLENRKILTLIDKIVYKNLIIDTIKLCIDQNNLEDAEKLLNKNKKLLESKDIEGLLVPKYIEPYKQLVINLVKKSIINNKVYNADLLLQLNKKLSILEDEVTSREIIIEHIKNYINNDNNLIYAAQALTDNKEWLISKDNDTYKNLVFSLFSRLILPRNHMEAGIALHKFLTNHENVIGKENIRDFYLNQVPPINVWI